MVEEERLILTRKERKALRVLSSLLPKVGKFNETDWQSVMEAFGTDARIKDETEAERIIASLESHGLANCSRYTATHSYSANTEPPKMRFKGFVTKDGIQFLRRENRSFLVLTLSMALYIAVGAFLLVAASLITGVTDIVSALWMGGLAGFGTKLLGIMEASIRLRFAGD